MWASVCLSILPQNCVQWLELTWAPSHNDWIPYLWPELTWKTLCWSIPQRPGGDPGSSNTDPSAGGSDSDHPPNIHSLQRREQTHRCVAWSHFTYSYRLRWECFVLACVVLRQVVLPGDSSRVRSASVKVCIMPSVSSGRLLIILKPFHMYIISCDQTGITVWRLRVKHTACCVKFLCVCVELYQHWHG